MLSAQKNFDSAVFNFGIAAVRQLICSVVDPLLRIFGNLLNFDVFEAPKTSEGPTLDQLLASNVLIQVATNRLAAMMMLYT